jgi:hypothetical protein
MGLPCSCALEFQCSTAREQIDVFAKWGYISDLRCSGVEILQDLAMHPEGILGKLRGLCEVFTGLMYETGVSYPVYWNKNHKTRIILRVADRRMS